VEQAWAQQQAGNFDAAARLCDRALAIRPDDAIALGVRGMAYFAQGNHDKALHLIQKGIDIAPRLALLYSFQGQVLGESGDKTAAEYAFFRAVTLDPKFSDGWVNFGINLLRQNRPEEAVRAFLKAAALAPRSGSVHMQLAETYYLTGGFEKARQELNSAKSCGLDEADANLWLGAIARSSGNMEEAETLEKAGLKASTNHERLWTHLARLSQIGVWAGRTDEAEHWIRTAMSLRPDEPGPYAELAAAKKFTEADRVLIEKMESILPTQDSKTKRPLEFALGKVYGDLGNHERSFAHYDAGNALARQMLPFQPEKLIAETDRNIALFPPGYIERLPNGSDSNLPILIVGTPRSGTTLTEQIVSSHTDVGAAGECLYWARVGPRSLAGFPDSYTPSGAQRIAAGYLDMLRLHSKTAPRVTDKMPTNFYYLGLIHAVFPNAKIIHCRRHPIDACLSIYFQNFSSGHAYKSDLESLAVFYEQYVRLMDHWRSVLPAGTMYEFWYEDLVEDTENQARRLLDFLGLQWEEGVLDFHKKERAVFTASKWQVRQPIYKTSRERWRRYEKHLGPLLRLLEYARQ
jgi:tetratricopeptide (TPR) repeat protein